MARPFRVNHEEVKRLFLEGVSMQCIAAMQDCCFVTVKKIIRKAGLTQYDNFDTGKMKALHHAGWSIHKIADEMGVEDEEIRRRLNE